jgi:hypothetical protein
MLERKLIEAVFVNYYQGAIEIEDLTYKRASKEV